ncbi:MAG: hypothetical protein EON98_10070 [Chitinophagaceae bacterium]|nr:MAG: hypothetical protein EON98_10070 [Chitinophagaceae bacterium]
MYTQADKTINTTSNYQKHPNLIMGLVTFVLLILGVGMRANHEHELGDILLISVFVLGAVHWVWSLIDVIKFYRADKASENRNIIWVILVAVVPPVGGMLFYSFNKNLKM